MRMCVVGAAAVAAAVGVASPALAAGDSMLSFTFSDLQGSFSTATRVFRAAAVTQSAFSTSGDVTRLNPSVSTAEFDADFAGEEGSLADVVFEIEVGIPAGGFASGSGGFSITDVNGDVMSGDIAGTWIDGGNGIVFFNGFLSNVGFSGGDGMFEGPSGGAFSTDFSPAEPPFEGAVISLFMNTRTQFFTRAFSNTSTQISGEIVPTPGAAALLGLAGLSVLPARRRRK